LFYISQIIVCIGAHGLIFTYSVVVVISVNVIFVAIHVGLCCVFFQVLATGSAPVLSKVVKTVAVRMAALYLAARSTSTSRNVRRSSGSSRISSNAYSTAYIAASSSTGGGCIACGVVAHGFTFESDFELRPAFNSRIFLAPESEYSHITCEQDHESRSDRQI
jgi:NADH:ubiquinone oxidoreductase subunit K